MGLVSEPLSVESPYIMDEELEHLFLRQFTLSSSSAATDAVAITQRKNAQLENIENRRKAF